MSGVAPDDPVAHLRLLERSAEAANAAPGLLEAAGAVLAAVCDHTGWPEGRVMAFPPPGQWGEPVIRRHPPGAGLSGEAEGAERPGPGLVADVRRTGKPAWGRSAVAVPVRVGGEVAAVLELSGGPPGEPPPQLLDLLVQVGHQLARVVERARAAAALRQSEERYRAVTETALDGIVTADERGAVVAFNRGAARIFGYDRDEVVGRPVSVLIPEPLRAGCDAGIARLVEAGEHDLLDGPREVVGLRRDGSEVPLEMALSTWTTAGGRYFTAILRDVSDRKEAEREREAYERQLAQRALHDTLTTLPNRALLHDRLEHALARAGRQGAAVAVVCLDLDRFRVVNESFGHHAGDELLVAVANRLEEVLRPGDTLARIGGDEFALLFEDATGDGEAVRHAERVVGALSTPFELAGRDVPVTASAGVALGTGPGRGADQVLRDAEMAMIRARQRGPGRYELFDDAMRSEAAERLVVESDLRKAITGSQLRLHYQPVVELSGGTVIAVEALLRWQHPTRGLLLPGRFISIAEESGLIVPVGQWVLSAAAQQAAEWQPGPDGAPLRMSVNVSARQFQQGGWTDEVARALEESGLSPDRLVLEITESVLMDDTRTTVRRLGELRDLGVRIAIDDFGTGYSSLGYLRQFPVDILKIDKSFIDGVASGPHESALARAVIKLASTLKLEAVAEGITSRKQYLVLRRLRCQFGQGFLFSRPEPAEVVAELVGRAVLDPEGSGSTPPW
jgi:diguanylate cyclase (GGDEF)-like protein/PAS domain S-box-containing protein